jgi:hypothetical protein
MIRNLDALKFVKIDRGSPSPKSRNLILDGFFVETQYIELHKRGLQKSPQNSSPHRSKQQRLNDPGGQRSRRKKKVRFVPEKRNQVYEPPLSPSQCHWTKADRQGLHSERSREAKTIVLEERSWGHLPGLLKQIHVDSYCPWDPPVPDPFLTHMYRHEPERLLGLERWHAPWRRSRDSWNAEAAANYALRLGLSLEESLTNHCWGDNQQEGSHDTPMNLDEDWGASFCSSFQEDPLSADDSDRNNTGPWV